MQIPWLFRFGYFMLKQYLIGRKLCFLIFGSLWWVGGWKLGPLKPTQNSLSIETIWNYHETLHLQDVSDSYKYFWLVLSMLTQWKILILEADSVKTYKMTPPKYALHAIWNMMPVCLKVCGDRWAWKLLIVGSSSVQFSRRAVPLALFLSIISLMPRGLLHCIS